MVKENKNTGQKDLNYLNNLLFEQMESLVNAPSGDKLKEEVTRTSAIVKVATIMVNAGKLGLAVYDVAGGQKTELSKFVALETKSNNLDSGKTGRFNS